MSPIRNNLSFTGVWNFILGLGTAHPLPIASPFSSPLLQMPGKIRLRLDLSNLTQVCWWCIFSLQRSQTKLVLLVPLLKELRRGRMPGDRSGGYGLVCLTHAPLPVGTVKSLPRKE